MVLPEVRTERDFRGTREVKGARGVTRDLKDV